MLRLAELQLVTDQLRHSGSCELTYHLFLRSQNEFLQLLRMPDTLSHICCFRVDDEAGAVVNAKYLAGSAIYAAYEAIQLAAMCEKLVEMAERSKP